MIPIAKMDITQWIFRCTFRFRFHSAIKRITKTRRKFIENRFFLAFLLLILMFWIENGKRWQRMRKKATKNIFTHITSKGNYLSGFFLLSFYLGFSINEKNEEEKQIESILSMPSYLKFYSMNLSFRDFHFVRWSSPIELSSIFLFVSLIRSNSLVVIIERRWQQIDTNSVLTKESKKVVWDNSGKSIEFIASRRHTHKK